MKKIFLSVFSLLLLQAVLAQRGVDSLTLKPFDSLKKELAASNPDTNRVMILIALMFRSRLSEGERYGNEAVELARKLNNKTWESSALRRLGSRLWVAGRGPEAITHLLQALRISEAINDKLEIGLNTKEIGAFYTNEKDYTKARPYLFRSKVLLQQERNYRNLSITLMFFGQMYYETRLYDSALQYYEQSYDMGLKSTYERTIKGSLKGLGDVYYSKGDYSVALEYYRRALSSAWYRSITYLSMAKTFHKAGRPDSALHYAKLSFDGGNRLLASQFLYELYDDRNDKEAYKYLKIYTKRKDSLNLDEKALAVQNITFQEQQNRQDIEAAGLETKNRMILYIVLGVLLSFVVIALILFRNNRHKQKAKVKIGKAYEELKATQSQLVQREKMASLGELTAGIAHEIQNPLNFVNNFSEVSTELMGELKEELQTGSKDEAIAIAADIEQNLEKITHHGKRADAIVKGMLQHSRTSTGKKEPTDINALADEYLRLSYHGLRAKDKSFNANFKTDFDASISPVDMIPQDIGRVLLNLYNNAFYSVNEKKKQLDGAFEPVVSVSTKRSADKVEICVRDNGTGIPQKILDKIYQPFFTTKPTGQGTGLGLSLSYDIIKAHGGELKVETKEGDGAEFVIELPVK